MSYDEGLHLIRAFLDFASHHTVEELQAFTSQWVPHPQWVKVDTVKIPTEQIESAAQQLEANLGPDGIREVGGVKWWQWRKPKTPLEAEWIEMKAHANERKKLNEPSQRVMLYVHGGAYFFGSVDEHRYQMQRHARKLKARVFAPKYRLSPQFPFPCGLLDCLAAYLYLLTLHDPSHIVLAGDSAGGGMVLAMLCIIRDQGIPLPAGGILISPWVDLTHSFPSVSAEAPMDYIPQCGFHHKPSRSWPPPNEDDIAMLENEAKKRVGKKSKEPEVNELEAKQQDPVVPKDGSDEAKPTVTSGGISADPEKFLTLEMDGETVTIKDQIQMYTTNSLLKHPLVSPVMQPSLGGLPPLLIMTGGGEILRDEQIYLAHKCANPSKYAPPEENLTEKGREMLRKYKPTDVQLQVWDDLCHVAPTLSFTRPAKYMYRSIAQFGAWVLARAQHRGIEIMDDDQISVISTSGSDTEATNEETAQKADKKKKEEDHIAGSVGKAGDSLPAFRNHMIRQRVTRHGITYPLAHESELTGCCMAQEEIGRIQPGLVKKWLATKNQWNDKFSSTKAKVHKKIVKDMAVGLKEFGSGEYPPPSALAGRRRMDSDLAPHKRKRNLGLALWSLWGSKHDEDAVVREEKVEHGDDESKQPETSVATPLEGQGARPYNEIQDQEPINKDIAASQSRGRSRSRTVVDENQTDGVINENTPVAELIALRKEKEKKDSFLSPDMYQAETGVAGKRPFLEGIAMPFTLKKEAETASMMTLQSNASPGLNSRPMSPADGLYDPPAMQSADDLSTIGGERPGLESFATAEEELLRAGGVVRTEMV